MKSIFIVFLLCISLFSYEKNQNDRYITYSINTSYDNLMFALLDEVSASGFVLAYEANISKGLKNISKLLNKQNVFINARKIGFCKSSLSLEMMQENPKNMMFCPLSLAVYELKKNHIVILYQKIIPLRKEDKIILKINKIIPKLIENLLDDIEDYKNILNKKSYGN